MKIDELVRLQPGFYLRPFPRKSDLFEINHLGLGEFMFAFSLGGG